MDLPRTAAADRATDGDHHDLVKVVTFTRILPTPDDAEIVVEMDGELRYESADPFAVTLTFVTLGGPVRWTLARDVLVAACYEPAGEGDVRVRPCLDAQGRSLVQLELSSPHGDAVLTTPAADVVAFCGRMLSSVPPGTESQHLDLDDVINRLLQDA